MNSKLNIVIVCAHPDDPEISAGGISIRFLEQGHNVTFVVATNGDSGHHILDRQTLKNRRYLETRKVGDLLGIDYVVMDVEDGRLEPTLENRENLIRILRNHEPDVVISHGLNDYHPDHRYTGQLVADTAYMLNVPLCVPDVPAIKKDVVYCNISYKPANDSQLTVLVPYDKCLDRKLQILDCHESQVYEWLPWIEKMNIPVPSNREERLVFLHNRWTPQFGKVLKEYYAKLSESQKLTDFNYYEAFTASLWGYQLTKENVKKYFPFDDALIV